MDYCYKLQYQSLRPALIQEVLNLALFLSGPASTPTIYYIFVNTFPLSCCVPAQARLQSQVGLFCHFFPPLAGIALSHLLTSLLCCVFVEEWSFHHGWHIIMAPSGNACRHNAYMCTFSDGNLNVLVCRADCVFFLIIEWRCNTTAEFLFLFFFFLYTAAFK